MIVTSGSVHSTISIHFLAYSAPPKLRLPGTGWCPAQNREMALSQKPQKPIGTPNTAGCPLVI